MSAFLHSHFRRDKLVCTLTGVLLPKREDVVWKHMMGKKFQKLLGKFVGAGRMARHHIFGSDFCKGSLRLQM